MRLSREAMAEHHRKIVEEGAHLLRERGLDGVGVAEIMQAAGLTHGGFYRHFETKDALVCEAMVFAFNQVEKLRNSAVGRGPTAQLQAFLEYYLSRGHCADPGAGCPIAAFGGEVIRASPDIRKTFAKGVEGVGSWIEARLGGAASTRRKRARVLLSLLVGTVVTARALEAEDARNALLVAGKQAALRLSTNRTA